MKKEQISDNHISEKTKYFLPEEMQNCWTVDEFLKEGEDSCTVLVKETATGIFCVLKWGRKIQAEMLRNEMEILQKLTEMGLTGIPKAYRIFEENGGVYFLREYIEGTPLSQMVMQKGGIQEREFCKISLKICQAVENFQKLEDPMIHRDIKPENIVVTPTGETVFIDFGTMRSYKKDSQRDTFVVGTRETAAPEQYGYRQTDQRTDVYAIGQTMLYMVTESYELDQLSECKISRKLKKIIEKACSFEPDKRYADAAELRKAIEKCQEDNRKMVHKKAGAAVGLTAAGCILAVFLSNTGILTDITSPKSQVLAESMNVEQSQNTDAVPDTENESVATNEQTAMDKQTTVNKQNTGQTESVTFKESLIEVAVRKELNLSESDTITTEMLENVKQIRIVGTEILDDGDNFWGIGNRVEGKDSEFGSARGSITDLTDLTMMKNIENLALCNQEIEDISALENLPLKELYLNKNKITDFSVLTGLTNLDLLCILENPAEDLSVLKECSSITRLNIESMKLADIDFLGQMNLNILYMNNAEIKDGNMKPLLEINNLQELCIGDVPEEMAEVLAQMSELKVLIMWGGNTVLKNLEPLKGMESLESLAVSSPVSSLEGIENFPNLYALSIGFSFITDLTPVLEAEQLHYIDISNAAIDSYEPLLEHPTLAQVQCTEEQKKEILELKSSPDFEILA
mgnify:FL=1